MSKMGTLVREWYTEVYPKDELGLEINPALTFRGLFEALDNYRNVYDVLGVADTVVRERCFEELAGIMGEDYEYIYDQWIRAADHCKPEPFIETEAVEPCPYCDSDNSYPNWNCERDGYIAVCSGCGNKIFLCDECLHADDNKAQKCDWREENGYGICFRGKIETYWD